MTLERQSPCKVNLLLNILRRRDDGFHELETVMHPVGLFDTLAFSRAPQPGVQLECASLPVDSTNLVHRAATAFLNAIQSSDGIHIRLVKRIPIAAGLGGGSGNAAVTLEGLNALFDQPLGPAALHRLATELGSDVPFFLQPCPALATGRGEHIVSLELFPALEGACFLLMHPGFGVPTAWAYTALADHPESLHGKPGRAQRLIRALQAGNLAKAAPEFYNALEAPVLAKYPLLKLYKDSLLKNGAPVALLSGSGATVFALLSDPDQASELEKRVQAEFEPVWTSVVPV